MDKKIEQYLNGKMEESEKATFERELAEDSTFKEKVEDYRIALQAIRVDGRAKLKNRLAKLDLENTETIHSEKKTNYAKIGIIFFFVLLLLISSIWFITNTPNTPTSPILKNDIEPQEKPGFQETIPNDIPEETLKPTSSENTTLPEKKETPTKPIKKKDPIAKTTPSFSKNKELFAQHFEPYQHPSLRPTVRGQGDLSPREKFELAYWEKEYEQLVLLWRSLTDAQKSNKNLLFLKAVALAENGFITEAKSDFEQLVQQKKHRFVQQSEWYLALITLYENDHITAKNSLILISKNTNHKHYQDAVDLLLEIENKN